MYLIPIIDESVDLLGSRSLRLSEVCAYRKSALIGSLRYLVRDQVSEDSEAYEKINGLIDYPKTFAPGLKEKNDPQR